MAGTSVLSGSLITDWPFSSSYRQPDPCTIETVLETVKGHISSSNAAAKKRRCVLLVYTLCSLIMDSDRYKDKFLLPLIDPEGLNHGFLGVGDIAISDENGDLFECIQILPNTPITPGLLEEAFDSVLPHTPCRFYLLTTTETDREGEDAHAVKRLANRIFETYGCEVIADGILPTLNCSLRFVTNPAVFLATYSQALREDFATHQD